MASNLVIVESPTKAKTIEKYLGNEYEVLASVGHVRDLPRSDFAVQVHNGDVSLDYEVPKSAAEHVRAIKKAAREAERVYLATDLDREGEAIAWHVAEVAGLDLDQNNRVVFTEITRDAVLSAFRRPRQIDDNLVDAQQARRAVDRIVGYRLSPTLWRNVARGISAGRVQSVALRMICDREDEIRAFVPEEYWSIHSRFRPAAEGSGREPLDAELHTVEGTRVTTPKDLAERAEKGTVDRYLVIRDGDTAASLQQRIRQVSAWTVADVTRRENTRTPAPPFTTSTLQQEAARKLRFSSSKTMRVAQQLYEGVDLGGGEQAGLITYHRTDSVSLSSGALGEVAELVRSDYGDRYALDEPRRYKAQTKGAQEAHEAIRPTSVHYRPSQLAGHLDGDQRALYELIWKRTVATQMAPAVFDSLRADVTGTDDQGAELTHRASWQVLKFDGFMGVYLEGRDDGGQETPDAQLPDLAEGQTLDLADVRGEQHFTEPPPRYTEASLVKTLEAEGIGRPSTYASIIGVLLQREYVRLESRRFFPTPLGEVVTAYLKRHFAEVVDTYFTARMEGELDEIARGEEAWGPMVSEFLKEVDTWIAERKPERPRFPLEGAACPECGESMVRVFSGKSLQWFASCHRWPECAGTLPLDAEGNVATPEQLEPDLDVPCPQCGKGTLRREGRFGPFYGCSDYPRCKGLVNVEQRIGFACPKCGQGHLVERRSRYGKPFYGCNRYPECDFALWTTPLAQPCPNCGGPLKPPRKNAKTPTAVCAHCEERVEVEADPPRVTTEEFVPGRRTAA